MIPKLCNSCGQHSDAKLASCYWAWMRADRTRVAYLQKLCITCFATQVLPLVVEAEAPLLACPACHIGTVDDHDDVFLTFFAGGRNETKSDWPLCGRCAVEVRNRAQVGAAQLLDRQQGSLGAASGPQPSNANDPWAALGLAPR